MPVVFQGFTSRAGLEKIVYAVPGVVCSDFRRFDYVRLLNFLLFFAFTLAFAGPIPALAVPVDCRELFARVEARRLSLKESRALDQAVLADFDDLTSFVPPSRQAATAWNNRVMQALERQPMPEVEVGERAALTEKQIEKLWADTARNPVAKETCNDVPNKYDPNPKNQIGFCFGRAIAVHVLARKMKLSNESIRKVWVVGGLDGGGVQWSHHVATAVRRKDGQWFVIDTSEVDGVVSVKDWLEVFRPGNGASNPNLLLFATNPDRFGPGSTDPLLLSTVTQDDYNGFFRDLFESTRWEGFTVREQLQNLSGK